MSGLTRLPSFFSFGQPSETALSRRGFFRPSGSRGIWGQRNRVQRSGDYLWELMRGNELICDTCKLETRCREGRGLGHLSGCNAHIPIWGEASCQLWRPWLCTEPCFWFKWDSFEKELKSRQKSYVPFPNILSQGSDADSVLCILIVLYTLNMWSPLSL